MPVSLNANALITLARAKDELDILTAATAEDDRVSNFINAASGAIEQATNRKLKQATYTHYFDGSGHAYLRANEFPVTSITSANQDDDWTWGGGTDIPVAGLRVLRDVYFARKSGFWIAKTPQSIKVIYVAGYAAVPTELEQACLELVKLIYYGRNDRRIGLSNKAKLGENVSYQVDQLPPLVDFLIAPFKRERYLADQMLGIILGGV